MPVGAPCRSRRGRTLRKNAMKENAGRGNDRPRLGWRQRAAHEKRRGADMINAKRKDIDCGLGAAVVELWKWRAVPMKAQKRYVVAVEGDIFKDWFMAASSLDEAKYWAERLPDFNSKPYKVMLVESRCVAEYRDGKVVWEGQKRKGVRRELQI